jgi:hypothetical protein
MHSNIILTLPPGASFPSKTPSFSNIVHTPISKRGIIKASLQPYPIWEIEYPAVEFIRGGEQDASSPYQALLGMYVAMGGSFGDFLYLDPNDNTIPAANPSYFGIGDGSTTLFQLQRSIGIGADIVQNPAGVLGLPAVGTNPPLAIYINGTVTTAYTMEALGIVQFSTPPAAGQLLTWSGSYYYRVQFGDDKITFDEFMQKVWNLKTLKLQSMIL